MKKCAWLIIGLLLAIGVPVASTAAATEVFSGQVWTWDEQLNTITLRRGVETIRVKVGPDQFFGLQLHQNATIRGTLAPPADIERVILPPPHDYTAIPTGPVHQAELTGRVTGVSASGVASVDTARGPLQVWVTPDTDRFRAGSAVRLRVAVQPVQLVARPEAASGAPPAPELTPVLSDEPGDYAVVTGQILRTDPVGMITVESPRGPIALWLSDVSRYRVAEPVHVWTSVHPAP
jgi:hypothetical protein